MIDVLLVAGHSLRSPHEPEFEDVVVATALDHLIAGIVGDVVVFVLLEKVISTHLIAVDQEPLIGRKIVWVRNRLVVDWLGIED